MLVAALVTGCGGSDPKPSSEFASEGALRQQADAIASKVEAVSGKGIDTEALHARLTNDCIRQRGVAIDSAPPVPVSPGIVPEITDLDLWLNRGQPLGLATALSDPEKLQEQRAFLRRTETFEPPPLPPEAQRLYEGDPPKLLELPLPGGRGGSVTIPVGGCFGEATRRLYGVAPETFERTRLELPRLDAILDKATSDGRVDDAAGAYEDCMRRQGTKARTPAALQDTLAPVLAGVLDGTEQPSRLAAVEQRVIANDTRCKTSSGLGTAFAKAFVDKGRAALADAEGVVVEYGRMVDHARSVAKRLKSEGS